MTGLITITDEAYSTLVESYTKLERLEECGVDNWDHDTSRLEDFDTQYDANFDHFQFNI